MEPETRRNACRLKTGKAGDEAGDQGAGNDDSDGRKVEVAGEHQLWLAEPLPSLKRCRFAGPFPVIGDGDAATGASAAEATALPDGARTVAFARQQGE